MNGLFISLVVGSLCTGLFLQAVLRDESVKELFDWKLLRTALIIFVASGAVTLFIINKHANDRNRPSSGEYRDLDYCDVHICRGR